MKACYYMNVVNHVFYVSFATRAKRIVYVLEAILYTGISTDCSGARCVYNKSRCPYES